MKTVTLLVVALVVGTSGFLIKVPVAPTTGVRTGNVGYVHIQKLILPLFENVCEDSVNPIIVRLAQEFESDSSSGVYLKPEVLTTFQALKTKGLLPKGEIFTDYNTDHLNELRIIYEVLFYAKDFDTFFKAAAWARQNVNCGLFVRAIYLAIMNRRDTEKISVPAPYELLPNYFIHKDVIVKASALLAGEEVLLTDNVRDEGNSYVLDANYTADFIDAVDESKLAYFHEDIGLNTYFFLQKLKLSPWFDAIPNMNLQYGEYLYHMMKQLAARYNLERYANGLPDVENIILDDFTVTPYDPMLIYSNGNYFGYRTTSMNLINSESVQMLHTIENSITSVVTHMKEAGYNKTQILDHLMGILVTGERSFERLIRASIGKDNTFAASQPSVLDHYMTSPRDPMFWKINKKIVDLIDDALKEVPVYTRNELYFPGVEVLNVDVKKIMTNFDYFQFDVTDSLKTDTTNTAFQVKLGQPRLSHKPFVVKLNISSLVTQKGLVKIYLGPKSAPGELALKKNLFMLLDSFEWNFKIGSNIISRSSEEMKNLSEDFTSLRTFRKNVEDAEFGLNALPLKDVESCLGFPQRLILPRGTSDGLPLQIFVFVAPFVKTTFGRMFAVPNLEFNSAILSPGYPLDLDIYDSQLFDLPNAMVKDIFITHKSDKVSNFGGTGVTKKWSKGNYDPSSRPDYLVQQNKPFDYTAKKAQYEKKEGGYGKQGDFTAKREYYKEKGKGNKSDDITVEPNLDVPENTFNEKVDSSKYTFGDINKTQYESKVELYENQEDSADKQEFYKGKSDTIKDVTETPKVDVLDDLSIGKSNLEKYTVDDVIIKKIKEREPVQQTEFFPNIDDDVGNVYGSLPRTYTRQPTVYDYIFNPEDFYDEVDIDSKVYE